jgi:D-tagatose-1,6-bisphosphate aldolase subunit GatZ/KbaZ
MKSIGALIQSIIDLRERGKSEITLLAICPNSTSVLEAAIQVAKKRKMPMLFAATLNQVDRDGGYTGWTQGQFVNLMHQLAQKYDWDGPLYPCLDHGGPWLKDVHTLEGLSYEATMREVKKSITACLEAGYRLLHIDPTVDRNLASGEILPVETVVERTIELITHSETERERLGLPPIDYEVGTEEVHGGLVDLDRSAQFLHLLREQLEAKDLSHAWPCFVVAQVGTDLHTTLFDPGAARELYEIVAPMGSLVKGHYTDWVENPSDYPATGMGGANVGPEFTNEEYLALRDLVQKENQLIQTRTNLEPSGFMEKLQQAVVDSGRWKKWLQPQEKGLGFDQLTAERQDWLLQTGARYIWTAPVVHEARMRLFVNLSPTMPDPHDYVVERIAQAIEKYAQAFNLTDSLNFL